MEQDPKYQGSLRQTCEEIAASRESAIAVRADPSKSEDRERLFAEVVERVGAPDILVNNAAVTFLRPLDEFPDKRVRLMKEMHVLAPRHLTQLAIPALRNATRLSAQCDIGRRGSPARSAVLRFRPRRRIRNLRDGKGRVEPVDEKLCS